MKWKKDWEEARNSPLADTLKTYGVNVSKLPIGAAIQFAEGGIIIDELLEVDDLPIIAAEELVITKKFYPHPDTHTPTIYEEQ